MESKEELPLVSLFIPAFNHEKYVAECIESVINQEYQNIELIIIIDGSKDSTHDVIINYEQKCRGRFVNFEYRNRENMGLSATLNEMVAWSQWKYFTVVASDDAMLPNKISLLVNKLESLDNSYAVAFGNATFIDKEGKELYLNVNTGESTTKEAGFNLFLDYYTYGRNIEYKNEKVFGSYETILAGNYLPAMSYIMKLEIIKNVGTWTNGNTIEDWEMWLKISKDYKFAYVDESVALYRLHENNAHKLIKKDLIIDSIKLLNNEKLYAFSKKLHNIYFLSKFSQLNAIKSYSSKLFIFGLLKQLRDFRFVIFVIKKAILKFNK